MLSESTPSRLATRRWLRLTAATALASVSIFLAYRQVRPLLENSNREFSASSVVGMGRPRVQAPDFWLRDHASGRAEAKKTGKPMFLVIRCEP